MFNVTWTIKNSFYFTEISLWPVGFRFWNSEKFQRQWYDNYLLESVQLKKNSNLHSLEDHVLKQLSHWSKHSINKNIQ